MNTQENYTLDHCLELLRKRLFAAQKDIINALEKHEGCKLITELHSSHGIKSNYNDYRDYYWIKATYQNNIYWITLFYQDVDKDSGNFHTQFGRIQFCKINPTAKSNSIGTPNDQINGHWYINTDNFHDPHLRIDAENYSPEKVADEFLKYLTEQNK